MNKIISLSCALAMLAMLSHTTHAATLNSQSTLRDLAPIPTPTTPKFSMVIEDLPLMPELTIVPDNDVIFVIPHSGRIAETIAVGIVDVDDVYRFYRRSLPQLGWKIADARSFVRDNEQLRITARADGKVTRVEFAVTPLKQKQ